MTATTSDRVVIALDLFPASAEVAGTTYKNVRAVIADGGLSLYHLGNSGPEIVYQRAVTAPIDGTIATGMSVTVDDGSVWIEQDGGCGCGSALKVADLWPGRQRVFTGLR